jgi:phosphatidylglycerophosphate synthase
VIPDLLSLVRLVLAAPLVLAVHAGAAHVAAAIVVVAVLTDLLDGPLARRGRGPTERGRWLDHLADFVFVCAGLAVFAWRGALPAALPAAVALAFAQYAASSKGTGRGLRMSRIGRYNGVAYFAPLVGALLVELGVSWLAPAVVFVSWLLVATTALSLADRLGALGSASSSR